MIRDLKLICRPYHNDGVSLYDWLVHLSPVGLWAISIDQIGPNAEFTAAVMACPALQGVRRLELQGNFLSLGVQLDNFLGLPDLHSLSVELPHLTRNLDVSAITPIKNMRLDVYELDQTAINLLAALQSSLSWLDLRLKQWNGLEGALLCTLSRMSKLQHLAIDAQYKAHYPFMDEVLPHLPALRYVHCSHGTWGAALFIAILPTLNCLSLQGSTKDPFPIDAVLNTIHHMSAQPIHLRSLVLVRQTNLEILSQLRDACVHAGIQFRVGAKFQMTEQMDSCM